MPRRRALTICTVHGCPQFTDSGRCAEHRREADARRGTARQRGYGGKAWEQARTTVLTRDPVCTLGCGRPSTVADHWPTSRRDLLAQGVPNPDAPERMRGVCRPCHSKETANTPGQEGGFNQR